MLDLEIVVMFNALSRPDPYEVQFRLEQRRNKRREYDAERYRDTMASASAAEVHRARKRAWWREYSARRRAMDPAFVEQRRAIQRRSERKRRAKERAARRAA